MKTITANVTMRVVLKVEDDADVSHIFNEMNAEFEDTTGIAEIVDFEMLEVEVLNQPTIGS